MKFIDNEEAKKIELEILVKFAQYCDKNNLRYHLAYGTLLGAIRHKGFIPWDNDIDVTMPRPDYEKFRKMVRENEVASYISCLDYKYCDTFPFLKLVDNRTICKEHFLVTENNMGLYIDIFPLDGVPQEIGKQKKILLLKNCLGKLYAIKNSRFNTGSTIAKRIVKNILHPLSFIISNKWLCDRYNTLCKKYEYDKCNYVGDIVWGEGLRDIYPKAWFEDDICLVFESHQFRAPKEYDLILKQFYGDYMCVPKEEERITHFFEAYWR